MALSTPNDHLAHPQRRNPTSWLTTWGSYILSSIARSTRVFGLIASTLAMVFAGGSDGQRIRFSAVLRQIAETGALALGLTAQLGFSIGLVFGISLETSLQWVDLLEIAIGKATEVLVEQVAPLFVAIMVATRSGAALAADLGSMVAAHEIDALRSMGLSAERLLVAPAILGALVTVPLLTVIMIATVLLTFSVYLHLTQISSVLLSLSVALNAIEPAAISTALSKGALFGTLIMAIAADNGLAGQPTMRMVGRSVTNALVAMIANILLLNAVLTLLF